MIIWRSEEMIRTWLYTRFVSDSQSADSSYFAHSFMLSTNVYVYIYIYVGTIYSSVPSRAEENNKRPKEKRKRTLLLLLLLLFHLLLLLATARRRSTSFLPHLNWPQKFLASKKCFLWAPLALLPLISLCMRPEKARKRRRMRMSKGRKTRLKQYAAQWKGRLVRRKIYVEEDWRGVADMVT